MKNEELEVILEGIKKCGNQSKQPFRTKMMVNARLIKEELKNLYESVEEPEGIEEYRKKEQAIVDTYALGNQDGQPYFGENNDQVVRELTELKKQYAGVLEAQRKVWSDFRKNVMSLDVAIKLRFIEETELPKELTLDQAIGIDLLINYSEAGK